MQMQRSCVGWFAISILTIASVAGAQPEPEGFKFPATQPATQPAGGGKPANAPPIVATWRFRALSGLSVLQVRNDKTFLHHGSGFKYVGKWAQDAADPTKFSFTGGGDDWVVTFDDKAGALSVSRAKGGTLNADRVAADERIVQQDKTPAEFFTGKWYMSIRGGLGTTPYGNLEISAENKATYRFNDGPAATGTWKPAADFDGIVVEAGGVTYKIRQFYADNQMIAIDIDGTQVQGSRPREK